MPLPASLIGQVEIPVIGAPMLSLSSIELVVAQCTSGIVGAFPALEARPQTKFDEWLCEIEESLASFKARHPEHLVSPYAVNQIVHRTNTRQDADLEICLKHRVPVMLTSSGPSADIVKDVHSYGGIVLHDVASVRHAEKALDQGVDGLILVCAGAGGQGGTLNPFAFVAEVRRFYAGPLAVAGTITTGKAIAAMEMMGADLAMIGTLFIATPESDTDDRYRKMVVNSRSKEVILSPYFSGIHVNWLKPSIAEMGLDPDDPKLLWTSDVKPQMGDPEILRRYKDILSAGQGVGNIDAIAPAAVIIDRLKREYRDAVQEFTNRHS